MPTSAAFPGSLLRFGPFEFEASSGRLRRNGKAIRLQPQPAKVMALLLSRPGQLITREEFQQEVWGKDTFVDFERGLNFCIRQIRATLEDSSDQPKFVETIARRGYRFIADVNSSPGSSSSTPKTLPHSAGGNLWPFSRVLALAAPLSLVGLLTFGALTAFRSGSSLRPAKLVSVHSIAVLPLENLSGDPSQEYFADGMTEALTTNLAKISALRVIARTSMMGYKNKSQSLPDIAQEFGVDAVVEGSVARSGDQVRVTAHLVEAVTQSQLWADTYDRNTRDVLTLESEIAKSIVDQIQVKLTPDERARLTIPRPVNPEAHEAYLRGRYFWGKQTCDGLNKALSYFNESVERDASFAPPQVGMAESYYKQALYDCAPAPQVIPKAKQAALKALALDEGSGEAHAALGAILFFHEWNWVAAEREFKRALDLSPNYPTAHAWYATLLLVLGREKEASTQLTLAHQLDPISLHTNSLLEYLLYVSRQYDKAVDLGAKTLEMYPDAPAGVHMNLAEAYEKAGKSDQAMSEYMTGERLQGTDTETLAAFRRAYEQSGIAGYHEQAFSTARAHLKPGDSLCDIYPGDYLRMGDKQHAFQCLGELYQEHSNAIAWLTVDPVWDSVRSDARFQQLLRKVGFPQYHQATER